MACCSDPQSHMCPFFTKCCKGCRHHARWEIKVFKIPESQQRFILSYLTSEQHEPYPTKSVWCCHGLKFSMGSKLIFSFSDVPEKPSEYLEANKVFTCQVYIINVVGPYYWRTGTGHRLQSHDDEALLQEHFMPNHQPKTITLCKWQKT